MHASHNIPLSLSLSPYICVYIYILETLRSLRERAVSSQARNGPIRIPALVTSILAGQVPGRPFGHPEFLACLSSNKCTSRVGAPTFGWGGPGPLLAQMGGLGLMGGSLAVPWGPWEISQEGPGGFLVDSGGSLRAPWGPWGLPRASWQGFLGNPGAL